MHENLIEAHKQIEQELIQAKADLEVQSQQIHQLRALGKVAGGVAHEFGNLLVPIIGFTKMVQNNMKTDSTDAGYLSRVIKTAYRAKKIVNQVRLFSHKQEIEQEPKRLDIILNQELKKMLQTLPKAIRLTTEIDSNTLSVASNSAQLQQLIKNLYENAVDAMPEGGCLQIRLHNCKSLHLMDKKLCKRDQSYVCMVFEDTGHGMNAEIQEQIFDPFFTTREKESHTGLGLSVVLSIIDQLNGYIDVKSGLGEGSAFYMYFPGIITQAENVSHLE